MASQTEITNMAVFCDFENVALGVRDANYAKFDIDKVLERLLLKGNIVVRKAYCDWDRYKQFKRSMHEASFELIEIPHVRQSGKNSADIRMVVDALDLCYTKAHLDTFVLLTGDSDFSPLVAKLRENAKTVIGVGVKQSTSDLLINICDEFIYYDDLVREQPAGRGGMPRGRPGSPRRSGSARPDGNGHAIQPLVGPPLPLHESLRGPARGAPRERKADGGPREAAVESAVETLTPTVHPPLQPAAEASPVAEEGAAIDGAVPAAEGDVAAVPAPRGRARAKSTRARAGSRRGSTAAAADAAEAGSPQGTDIVPAPGEVGLPEPVTVPVVETVAADAPAPAAKGRARRPRAGSKAALAAAAKLAEAEAEAAAEPVAQPSAGKGAEVAEAGTNPAAIHPADPVSDGSDKAQQAIDLVLATVEALVAERGEEERIWGSMVKQTLKRRNPGFNESYYGFRTFSELLEEAQARRLLELTRDEKSGGFILRLTHHDD
ncbi:MAG: NYN domain-containing protein [bacterium]